MPLGAARAAIARASIVDPGFISSETFDTAAGDPIAQAITVPANCNLAVIGIGWESARTLVEMRIGATGSGASGEVCTKDVPSERENGVSNSVLHYLANPTTGVRELWVDFDGSHDLAGEIWYFSSGNTSTPFADSEGGTSSAGLTVQTATALVPAGINFLIAVAADGFPDTHTWGGSITEGIDTLVASGAGAVTTGRQADITSNITPSVTNDDAGNPDMTISAALVQA